MTEQFEIDAETQLIWSKCAICGIGLHKDEINKFDEFDVCNECFEEQTGGVNLE